MSVAHLELNHCMHRYAFLSTLFLLLVFLAGLAVSSGIADEFSVPVGYTHRVVFGTVDPAEVSVVKNGVRAWDPSVRLMKLSNGSQFACVPRITSTTIPSERKLDVMAIMGVLRERAASEKKCIHRKDPKRFLTLCWLGDLSVRLLPQTKAIVLGRGISVMDGFVDADSFGPYVRLQMRPGDACEVFSTNHTAEVRLYCRPNAPENVLPTISETSQACHHIARVSTNDMCSTSTLAKATQEDMTVCGLLRPETL